MVRIGFVGKSLGLSGNFSSINLNTSAFRDGWWQDDTSWRHSDMKDVAYRFVYRLFDDIVVKGVLK